MAGTGTAKCADNRVIVIDPAGNIVWQYGQTGVSGDGANQLNNPNSAELLENGGPELWDAFMAELRTMHLDAPPVARSVFAELQNAYLAVVAKNKR